MEWYIMNASGVRGLTSGLVTKISDEVYQLNDECEEDIGEILGKLSTDDPHTSLTKRHLLTEQIVIKDLIPILIYTTPDVTELGAVLNLLSVLSEPLNVEGTTHTVNAASVRYDLEKLRRQVRNAFLDINVASRLFHHISELIEEAGEYEMSKEGYDVIYHFLCLIRNILYFAQNEACIKRTALHGLLLRYNVSSVLMFSIRCHRKERMAIPLTQILSLLLKNFQEGVVTESESDMSKEEIAVKDYVGNKLYCLIVSLLQGPITCLLASLKSLELNDPDSRSSDSYMTWCLAYFVPYICRVNIPFSKIGRIVSTSYVGYLVYKLSILSLRVWGNNLQTEEPYLSQDANRLYLAISALETILKTAMSYPLSSLDHEELKGIMQFYKDIVQMADLWQIILFYIRNYEVTRFPRSFLAQLVNLNHDLLTIVELYNQMSKAHIEQTVISHIQHFASPQVMKQYTLLVETYSTNTCQTNMAVFTMLCHICVDCKNVQSLYNPILLRCLGNLSGCPNATEEDLQFADYVTRSFLDDLNSKPEVCVGSFMGTAYQETDTMEQASPLAEHQENITRSEPCTQWTDDEESDLFSVYADTSDGSDTNMDDVIKQVTSTLSSMGIQRTKQDVQSKLVQCGLIHDPNSQAGSSSLGIHDLVSVMTGEGSGEFITWIHNSLVTASYVQAMPKARTSKLSPVCRYSILQGHDIPMIPYSENLEYLIRMDNNAQQLAGTLELSHHHFTLFIQRAKSAGQLYSVAEKLKPVMLLPNEMDTYTLYSSASSSSGSCSADEDMVVEDNNSKLTSEIPTSRPSTNVTGSRDQNLWLNFMRMQK